LRPWV
jgi:predicted transposase YbfD/YdcC